MRILDYILDLLYPPKCAFCRRLLRDGENGACRSCLRKLPYVPGGERREKIKNVSRCIVALYYRDAVRESLLRYKFEGITAYKDVYAGLIADAVRESGEACDLITWAPLSKKRLKKRGYDQTELIARSLSARLNLPCVRTLEKVRDNPPQSSIDDERERKKNVSGIYRCIFADAVRDKRVLIVDDIVTSGATLAECAGVLKASGAESIIAAAAASAH